MIYKGESLILKRFWGNNEPCLWIKTSDQINIPKMEFVGGSPDEYCIFIKNLSEEELAEIIISDGSCKDITEILDCLEYN